MSLEAEYQAKKVADLKALCKQRDLSDVGKKNELIDRYEGGADVILTAGSGCYPYSECGVPVSTSDDAMSKRSSDVECVKNSCYVYKEVPPSPS